MISLGQLMSQLDRQGDGGDDNATEALTIIEVALSTLGEDDTDYMDWGGNVRDSWVSFAERIPVRGDLIVVRSAVGAFYKVVFFDGTFDKNGKALCKSGARDGTLLVHINDEWKPV